MIRCIDCANWNLRQAGHMARLGYGVCLYFKEHRTFSATYQRECKKFESAAPELVAQRVEWMKEAK